ncbi:agmatine deiminase family protein [Methylonatrum kenyense]|uniref:agmatine deiminase family protein n=1 Tax=Methylonatrum kenyense TaxID=455253 RepID=UPI0020C014DE|nr:agmatine deiminase family protein [Methylonatrum kenyense]MCK8516450.1 agmatine deiminase family protein [Methylonatrum kenyense]
MSGSNLWLPPEWAAQRCVMLTWPHDRGDWADGLAAVEQTFVAMASAIGRFQRVLIACRDQGHREHVARQLPAGNSFDLAIAPSNDIWVRDHGPITVIRDGTAVLLDFRFDGWGGKYPAELDDALTRELAEHGHFRWAEHQPVPFVFEGGSIDCDGNGTLLTTSRCLLDPSRNGPTSRAQVEQQLLDLFACDRVHWLDHGHLDGDDTDGHVDMLARFAPGDTILYTACDDPQDSHAADLGAMEAELAQLRTREDKPYTLLPLPWPEPCVVDDRRLPLSYANFLVINGAVLVPCYAQAGDTLAMRLIGEAFPDREIIPIPALPLVRQHGSVHCASMQIPLT